MKNAIICTTLLEAVDRIKKIEGIDTQLGVAIKLGEKDGGNFSKYVDNNKPSKRIVKNLKELYNIEIVRLRKIKKNPAGSEPDYKSKYFSLLERHHELLDQRIGELLSGQQAIIEILLFLGEDKKDGRNRINAILKKNGIIYT